MLHRLILLIAFSLVLAATGVSLAYAEPPKISIGTSVAHPEAITGAWETWISPSMTVGMAIGLIATVDGAPATLRNMKQKLRFIRIVTYTRDRERSRSTLWNSDVPGDFNWKNNRLRLHQIRTGNVPYDVDLDLVFDPATSQWKGFFKNPDFAGQVILKRPDYKSSKSSPIGTWRWGAVGDSEFSCLHVGMGIDGQLLIWSDFIELSGRVIYGANGTRPPAQTDESYGVVFAEDPRLRFGGLRWMFDYSNGLWGEFISGQLSENGSTFSGESTHYGNGIGDGRAHPFSWERVMGDSCAT